MNTFTKLLNRFHIKYLIVFTFSFLFSLNGWGQIATWTAASLDANPSTSLNANTKDPNLTSAVLARNNLTAGSGSSRYNSSAWTNANAYLTITLTPASGYALNMEAAVLSITMGSSNTGPDYYYVYSSADNYTNSLGTLDCGGSNTSITLPSTAAYNGLSSIIFRIVPDANACKSGSTFGSAGTGGPGNSAAMTIGGSCVVSSSDYYWNGGSISATPAAGGTGTWTTTNAWRTVTSSGSQATFASGQAGVGNVYFAGTAGTVTDNSAGTYTATGSTGFNFNTTGYIITTTSSSNTVLNGNIVLGNNVGLTLAPNSGTPASSGQININGNITGTGTAAVTINAASNTNTRIDLIGASATVSVPTTVSGTGTGWAGYVMDATPYSTGTISGNISVASGNRLMLAATNNSGQNTLDVTGTISGSGGVIIVAGASGGGGIVNLSKANTYTGNTEVFSSTNGILQNGIANALGQSGYLISTSGSYDMSGYAQTVRSLKDGTSPSNNVVTNSGAAATLTLSQQTGDAHTFSGVMSGAIALVLGSNASTTSLTLSGTNTYTGGTTVTDGTLNASSTTALGAATNPLTVNNNNSHASTVNINNNITIGSLAGTGTPVVSVASSTTLTCSQTANTSYSGNITGSGTFTKQGSGTLTLSGTCTSTGPWNVTAGTLLVNGTINTSASAWTISGTGVLGGTGTITRTIALQTGTTISPATVGTVGELTIANGSLSSMNWGTGSKYRVDISNVTTSNAGSDYDQIAIAGNLTISATSGNPMTIDIAGNPTGWNSASPYTWTIATAGSVTSFAASSFALITTNFTATIAGTFSISQSGNNIVLIYTPTPTLSVTSLTAFGNGCVGIASAPYSFTITGTNLSATAPVTVASLSGYSYSITSGGSYSTSLSISQSGGSFSQVIYVEFTPTSATTFSGNIVVGGGGASSKNVAASGTGVAVPITPTCSTPGPVCQGVAATITGSGSTGSTTYTYWTQQSPGGTQYTTGSPTGYTVSGGNLTTPTTLAGGSTYTYYVEGDNATCSSASRQAVTVTVTALPATPAGTITPAANPACTSTTLSYSSPSASIYWETSASGTSTSNSPAATTSNYTLSSTGTIYARAYSGGCWSSGSASSGSVTINTAPSISASPSNKSISAGSNTTFTVTASNAASYLWEVSTDGGNTWNTVSNGGVYSTATTATLNITGATYSMNGYEYQVIVGGTSPCTSATSSAATLTVTMCDPTYSHGSGSGSGDYFTQVSIAGTTLNNNPGQLSSPYYTTEPASGSSTANLSIGTSYTLSVASNGVYGEYVAVWIDLNQDGVYNSTTEYIGTVNLTSSSTGTISIPASVTNTALAGSTHMRLVMSESSISASSSCGSFSYGEAVDYIITFVTPCTSPNTLAFVAQPSNVVQNATMSTVTVKAYCSSSGTTATSYTGAVTLTVSGGGCGYVSQTVNAVAGIATFSGITFDRSTQTGITMTATASGLTTAVSNSFNVTAPTGTPVNTTIINENFDGSTPHWTYTSANVSNNGSGTSVVGLKNYGGTYNNSLTKSYSADLASKDGESTDMITFANQTGLGSYNSVQVSFLIGSLGTGYTGNDGVSSGAGTDENETMIIQTSLDGGTTWNTLLTYYGYNDYLFPLSATSPVTLAYNANASYNADHSNSSTQSAFVINLPSGTAEFQMRIQATDNRTNENWAIDNIQVIGTTTGIGVTEPLPSATGATYSTCSSTGQAIGVALSNTQGTVSYQWSPTTNISSATSVSPTVTVSTATSYSVTATDADGCTASATDVVNITTPSGNVALASATVSLNEPSCPDGSGWTYYTDPSNSSLWDFAIYKNGNSFTANVDLTLETTSPTYELKSSSSYKEAVYTMGRYWNVVVASGSINGTSNPIKVRFFYNPSDTLAMRSAAVALAQNWGLTSANVSSVEWFKTVTGTYYNPANNTYADVPNKLSPSSYTVTTGTINGISYVEYDGLKGFSGGSGGIRVSPGGYALPVELLYLTADPVDNTYIRLNWATASEVDNLGFEVERSIDGINFTKINFAAGNGKSETQNNYTLKDINVIPDAVYYYRLKQMDIDGNYEYSTVVSAMLLSQQGFVMDEPRPNPASSQVIINVIAAYNQTSEVYLYDMLGRQVLSQQWDISPGLNGTKLDIDDLPSGNYVVSVRSTNGIFSKRLAVVR